MDLAAIRQFVNDHPHGVTVRMIDGTEHRAPHRDFVNFGPVPERRSARSPHATSFFVWKDNVAHLVNALLVKEVVPMRAGGARRRVRRRSGR